MQYLPRKTVRKNSDVLGLSYSKTTSLAKIRYISRKPKIAAE